MHSCPRCISEKSRKPSLRSPQGGTLWRAQGPFSRNVTAELALSRLCARSVVKPATICGGKRATVADSLVNCCQLTLVHSVVWCDSYGEQWSQLMFCLFTTLTYFYLLAFAALTGLLTLFQSFISARRDCVMLHALGQVITKCLSTQRSIASSIRKLEYFYSGRFARNWESVHITSGRKRWGYNTSVHDA